MDIRDEWEAYVQGNFSLFQPEAFSLGEDE